MTGHDAMANGWRPRCRKGEGSVGHAGQPSSGLREEFPHPPSWVPTSCCLAPVPPVGPKGGVFGDGLAMGDSGWPLTAPIVELNQDGIPDFWERARSTPCRYRHCDLCSGNVRRLLGDMQLNRDVITTRGDLFCGMSNGQSCVCGRAGSVPSSDRRGDGFSRGYDRHGPFYPLAARRETEPERAGSGNHFCSGQETGWDAEAERGSWMTKHGDYLRRQ
jgi:hypothetical protein